MKNLQNRKLIMNIKKVTSGLLASAVVLSGGLLLQPSAAFATTGLCAVNSDYADEEWISEFVIDGQSVLGNQGDTYTDNTASSLTTLQAGQTYNIDITISVDFFNSPGSNDAWDENAFAWLDLNQDGVVDLNTELLFTDGDNTTNFTQVGTSDVWTETFSGTFTVPAGAFNGVSVGRVMNQYVNPGDDPILCNSDPLAFDPGVSAFEFGSTTDFALTIQGGVDNPATTPSTPAAEPTLAETGSDASTLINYALAFVAIGGVLSALAFALRKKS